MDLTQNTAESVEFMVEAIKDKLKVMNFGAIKSTHFDIEMYEELHDIYQMVMKKRTSVSVKWKRSPKNSADCAISERLNPPNMVRIFLFLDFCYI